MQEWYLGWEKVSCLERCPQFRSVLIEREVPLYRFVRCVTCMRCTGHADGEIVSESVSDEPNEVSAI